MLRGGVVGRDTKLQAGRSRIRGPKKSMSFLNLLYPPNRTRPWGFTQPLTEPSTRNRKHVSGE
jgi:hypothetical protein